MKAIRGAITVDDNSIEEIRHGTIEMLNEIVKRNQLDPAHVIQAIWTLHIQQSLLEKLVGITYLYFVFKRWQWLIHCLCVCGLCYWLTMINLPAMSI